MMKKGQVKFSIITVVVLIASVVTARTAQHRYFSSNKKEASLADTAYKPPVYDKATLAAFESICQKYDMVRDNYTISGQISVTDYSDTSGKMKDVPFLCCKKGTELYYKLGKTETINAGGVYLYIDHQAKTILLSQQKELGSSAGLKMITGMAGELQSEDYQLSRKQSGRQQTYSLINEHHISCKEYSLTIDTATQQVARIFTRLSNPMDPLRKDNEKVIDVQFSRWEATADIKKYTVPFSTIRKNGSEWAPGKEYVNYQLIKM